MIDSTDKEYKFEKLMINYKKFVFTSAIYDPNRSNMILADANPKEEVLNLKQMSGKDILIYGGVSFVPSLIQSKLIDEDYLNPNTAAISKRLRIFNKINKTFELSLTESFVSGCGIVINKFLPKSLK